MDVFACKFKSVLILLKIPIIKLNCAKTYIKFAVQYTQLKNCKNDGPLDQHLMTLKNTRSKCMKRQK